MAVPFPAPLGPAPAAAAAPAAAGPPPPPPRQPLYWRAERGLRAVTYYPLLVGQIAVFAGIAFGVVGGELGLEALFWHEDPVRQLSVGLATGWLFGVVLYMNLLLLRPDWVGDWHRPPFRLPPGWATWRSLFPTRHRAYATVRRVGHWLLRWLVALLAVVWLGKVALRLSHGLAAPAADGADPWAFFRWYGGPGGGALFAVGYLGSLLTAYGLFLLDEHYPAVRDAGRRLLGRPPGHDRRPLRSRVARAKWFRGLVNPGLGRTRRRSWPWRQVHAIAFLMTAETWLVYAACVVGSQAGEWFSPAVLISLTLILLNTVAGIVAFRLPARLIFVAAAVVMYLVTPLRMTVPNLDYARPRDLGNNQYNRLHREADPKDAAGRPLLVDPRTPLAAARGRWAERHATTKPRLVLLAVSGGGIRAAVWTAVVLEGLEKELGPQLHAPLREHVRLVTGASGGMVAAGAYATFAGPLDQAARPDRKVEALRPFSAAVAADSLSAVVQTMALRDFTWSGVPLLDAALTPDVDRGRRLEEIWATHWKAAFPAPAAPVGWPAQWASRPAAAGTPPVLPDSPFGWPVHWLRDAEAAGRAPSVVFAPVFVEDTKRMLISNLDLKDLTAAGAPRLDHPDPVGTAPAMEFFRAFPAATDFTLGTAARLSASFPVVSPAVNLPTTPPRRLVDGGYYDNYGLDLATRWAVANKAALVEHTSGVLVIQVRAFPMEVDGVAATEVPAAPLDRFLGAVSAPAQAVLTARSQAAHHRNAEMLELAARALNADPARPFFQTVVFELNQPAALSWYLTSAEKRDVVRGFYADDDRTQLSPRVARQVLELKRWFGVGDGTWQPAADRRK